jgi:hypothetical protein
MKGKKLCFVIPSFGIGGIEINFQKLANHFNWSGYDVHIMHHAELDNGSFKSNFHEEIELDKLPKRKFLGTIFGYIKYFNEKRPAFVIVGMYIVAMQLIIARFVSNHKPKIIINGSAHLSSIIKYDESIKTRILLKISSKIFLSKADALVCQSNGIKEDLLKNFSISSEKLITIYNGVLTKNHNIDNKQKNIHRNTFIILNMNVCFVIPNFNFFKTHRADLIKELTAHYEMHVITDISLASKQEINEFSKQNINIHHLQARNGSMSFKSYYQYFKNLKKKINLLNLDYIFYTTLEISFFGALLKNFINIKKSFFLITGVGSTFLQ